MSNQGFVLEQQELFSLGDVVHNRFELLRSERRGLNIISHHQLDDFSNQKVYIRAHGEAPSTFQKCRRMWCYIDT